MAVDLSAEQLASIEDEIDRQARSLSRLDVLKQSIGRSLIVKADTLQDAIDFSNDYAPEHLILHLADANSVLSRIENAGSVFVGPFTPERYIS